MSDPNQKPWAEMTPCERNWKIGELIGEKPLAQLYLAVEGKQLWPMAKVESELEETRKMVGEWQRCSKQWKYFMKVNAGAIRPEYRGKITVEVHRWHIRYSEVPGGGWNLIEHLCKNGFLFTIHTCPTGWTIIATKDGKAFRATDQSVQAAACKMILEIYEGKEAA